MKRTTILFLALISLVAVASTVSINIKKRLDEMHQLYLTDRDSLFSQIEERKRSFEKTEDPVERSVYRMAVATMYQEYYNNNRYAIDGRTDIEGAAPDDMREWSRKNFKDSIAWYLDKALENRQALLDASTSGYRENITEGKDSALMPTMYDILIDKAIRMVEDDSVKVNELYNRLIEAHKNERAVHDAAQFRLYMYNTDRKNSECQVGFAEQYKGTPLYVYVKAYELNHCTLSPKAKHDACVEILDKYGDNPYITSILNVKETLERPYLEMENGCEDGNKSNLLYKGEEETIWLKYKNLQSVKVNIYRLNRSAYTYSENGDGVIELVKSETIALPDSADYDVHTYAYKLKRDTCGIYLVNILANGELKYTLSNHFFVTDIFVLDKAVDGGYEFYVVDRRNGMPLNNVEVKVYEGKNGAYRVLKTDIHGVAKVQLNRKTGAVCTFKYGKDEFYPAKSIWRYKQQRILNPHTYTEFFMDRGVYRPGQKVMAKGIVYNVRGDEYSLAVATPVTVKLTDANGSVVDEKEVKTNDYGSFYVEFTIPEGLLSGNFSLYTKSGSKYFRVEEYKRPTFEVKVDSASAKTINDKITISGNARYYRGSSVSGGTVKYKVTSSAVYYHWCNCILPQTKYVVASGNAVCDYDGNFTIEFLPEIISENRHPFYRLTTEVSVTDMSGETQMCNHSLVTGTADFSLSCPIDELMDKSKVKDMVPDAYDCAGNKVSVCGNYTLRSASNVYEGEFTSGQKLDIKFSALKSGKYTLTLNAVDSKGRAVDYKTTFIAYSVNDKKPAVDTLQWVIPVKTECENSDIAIVVAGSSYDTYTMLELYDQGKLVERKVEKMNSANKRFKIIYKPIYSDRLTAVFTTIYNGKAVIKSVTLNRVLKSRDLSIELSHIKKLYEPGEKDKWNISVKDVDGKDKSAEAVVAMYDLSLDAIASNHWSFNPVHKTFIDAPVWSVPYVSPIRGMVYAGNIKHYEYQFAYPKLYFDQDSHYYMRAGMNLYKSAPESMLMIRGVGSINDDMADGFAEAEEAADGAYPDVSEISDGSDGSVALRTDFAETAMFIPQLQVNNGECSIDFEAPQALTSWKLMILAYNKDIQTAVITDTVITKKSLSVNLNLPRFMRATDSANLSAIVENTSDYDVNATALWSVTDAFSGAVLAETTQDISIRHKAQEVVQCKVNVPDSASVLKVRVTVKTAGITDGVENLVPVLSTKIMVTETKPIELSTDNISSTMALQALPYVSEPKFENAIDLALAYYINWLAAEAMSHDDKLRESLKSLKKGDLSVESPLSANQNLKNILLQESPWVVEAKMETDRINSLTELLNTGKQSAQREKLLRKLFKLQNADGGFAWFDGGESSEYITKFVAEQLKKTDYNGKELTSALDYLSSKMETDYQDIKDKKSEIKPTVYDIKSMLIMGKRTTESYKHNYNSIKQFWAQYSLPTQAVIAQVLYADGDKELAAKVIDNLRKYMVYKPILGLYFPNTSTIETQLEYIKAFATVSPNDEELSNMKLWLLYNKQSNMWENSVATADALGALLLFGKSVTVSDSEALDLSVSYRQYMADMTQVQKHTDSRLKLDKGYYVERNGVLHKINPDEGVNVGDKVTVRLVVTADRDMEFIHIRDLRPAGLEPVNQISRRFIQSGLSYYMTTKDCTTDFFFDRMPKGTYVFEYQLNANLSGNYAAGFATIESMYSPDFKSQTEGVRMDIK
ncbi:MAG: MG2 domain-containing protein [Paludibacteraceae bacterium]|nr:MG2 domain-containing protein [Paludibacteraceae bacterium]